MHLYDVWLVYVRFTAIADLGQYFVNVTAELESDDCRTLKWVVWYFEEGGIVI